MKNLNTVAVKLLAEKQAHAVFESKRRNLNEEQSLELYIDTTLDTVTQLMNKYDASLDEAIDAYMSASHLSIDRQWLKNLITGNF